ncbi:MAG TPA: cytochrome P450, partial [Ktedonobacteraceae bacterium]|nr:cytochrome P450 [Ktedonobacteraceae bacterium]
LVRYKEGGEQLSDEEIRMSVFQMISAGANISLVIGSLLFELLKQPELWEQVHADRTLIPIAVEETLRCHPSSPWVMRLCREETTIGDVPIEAGKRIMLSIASANRDDEFGPDPDTFSLDRSPNKHPHLAFGFGPHFCLGAPLARLQVTIALEEFLNRLPSMRLAPDFEYRNINASMLHGPQNLEVCW